MDYDKYKLVFSHAQRIALKTNLKLSTDEQIDFLVESIRGSYVAFILYQEQRACTLNIKIARARVSSVYQHAAGLLEALEAVPTKVAFLKPHPEEFYARWEESLDFDKPYPIHESFENTLKEIMANAELQLNDENLLRNNFYLPPRDKHNQSIVHQGLWPALFVIYERFVGKVSYSVGGPLERYLATVHEAANLPPVVSITLKNAYQRWKRDKSRQDASWTISR